MFRRILAVLFLIASWTCPLLAQDVKVEGRFLRDSVRIGESLPYALTAKYPSALNLVFPDSTFSFKPFEIERKEFFPTVTKGNISVDSVVYYLTTFEVDTLQMLKLPAFVIHARDCTAVESNTDSVILAQVVHVKVDSLSAEQLPLKVNTDYLSVSWILNYPLLLIIGGILLVTLVVLWIIFGKRILRYYKLKRLAKNHALFVERYNESVQKLQEHFSPVAAESIFVLWKKYMENLMARPYTRYTAKEILRMERDETLGNALSAINRIIYAGINPSSQEAFAQLRAYTDAQFHKKTNDVKHG